VTAVEVLCSAMFGSVGFIFVLYGSVCRADFDLGARSELTRPLPLYAALLAFRTEYR
jgi:hypothetical protein